MRDYFAGHGSERFNVTIESLPKELRPRPPSDAARPSPPVNSPIPAIKWKQQSAASMGAYPALDRTLRYTDAKTHLPRSIRQEVVLVDRHFVILRSDVPGEQRDSKIAKRFFRSAKIE